MGFITPALPWIAKGAGALFGGLAAKKAQKSAQQRSPEELAALSGAQQAAGSLQRTGQSLVEGGMNLQRPAGSYYQTLLSGNRAAMAGATAAPRAAITDVYRGAERGLERGGVRGAAKDVATADLNRQRASQIAGLTTGMQPMAAEALAGMGGQQVSQGVGAAGAGAGIWGGLLGQGAANRMYARGEGKETGQQIGGLIFDLMNMQFPKRGGSTLPSRQTAPPYTPWMPPSGGGL